MDDFFDPSLLIGRSNCFRHPVSSPLKSTIVYEYIIAKKHTHFTTFVCVITLLIDLVYVTKIFLCCTITTVC